MIYFLITLVSSCLGVMSGLGGGMIIKPLLAFTHEYSAFTINFLSITTIIFMSTVSTAKNFQNKELKWEHSFIWIISGAVIGGIIGSLGFEYLVYASPNDDVVQSIQSFLKIVITFVFGIILQRMNITYQMKATGKNLLFSGIFAGIISSFLAIGGGLVNIFIFTKLLKFKMKDAINISLLTIIFSQLISLVILSFSGEKITASFGVILIMWLGAYVGVVLGGRILGKLSDKEAAMSYQIIVGIITLLNIAVVMQPFFRH